MATAGTIKVRVAVVDRVTAPIEWLAFQMWEDKAARNGSGLTREQMTGARLYHEWRHQRHEPRDPSLADPTDQIDHTEGEA